MGTRANLAFVIDGTTKNTYRHWDGNPGEAGKEVLTWLRAEVKADTVSDRADEARRLVLVPEVADPTPEHREQYGHLTEDVNGGQGYYALLRELQGNPGLILSTGLVPEASDVDPAYSYVVDFDNSVFAVLDGGLKEEKPLGSWSFDKLPTDKELLKLD